MYGDFLRNKFIIPFYLIFVKETFGCFCRKAIAINDAIAKGLKGIIQIVVDPN